MKKHFITLFERLRDIWQSLPRRTSRKHDPFLVSSMASFNFDGGSRELHLKISSKHMPAESTIGLVKEPVCV
jgi:hypothetical protein